MLSRRLSNWNEVFVKKFCILLAVLFCAFIAIAQKSADPPMNALTQELNRSFQNLKKTPVPPYFLAYQLTDNRAIRVVSSFGALTFTAMIVRASSTSICV